MWKYVCSPSWTTLGGGDASSEVAEGWVHVGDISGITCIGVGVFIYVYQHVKFIQQAGPGWLEGLGTPGSIGNKRLHNHHFNCHIHILLINANRTIYICYIIHRGR
jgi:hypothetical protein